MLELSRFRAVCAFVGRAAARCALFSALLLCFAARASAQTAPSGVWTYAAPNQISLNWNTVPGASGYNVYRGPKAGGEAATPLAKDVYPTYVDTAVTSGTAYFYKVTALFGNVESPLSVEASATVGATLSGPQNAVAIAGASQATINFSSVPGATFYRVFRYAANGYILVGTTTKLTLTETGLVSGIQYDYRVEAGNAGTDSSQDSNSATLVPGDAPVGATNFTMTSAGATSNGLQWNSVSGATNYVVYRGTSPNSEGATPYAITSGNGFTDTGLTAGTTYYYKIAALDYSGTGAAGPETSGTAGSTPLKPGLLTVTSGATSISLQWQLVSGATSYYIVRGQGNWYSNQQIIAKAGSTTHTFVDTAVGPSTAYVYTVAPATVAGVGPTSNQASAKLTDAFAPAPTGLYAASYPSTIQLNWDQIPGVYQYAVYRSSAGTPTLYNIIGGTGFTDTTVSAGVKYSYSVTAINTAGESPHSPIVTAVVNTTPLPGPLTTINLVGGQPTLYWNFVPGAVTYSVYRTVNQGWHSLVTGFKPGSGSTIGAYTDLTAPTGVQCEYYVAAVDANGIGLSGTEVGWNLGNPTPPIPTGTIAFGGNGEIVVNCNNVSGLNLSIYRGTKPGGEGPMPYAINVGTNFVDVNVKAGTTYYYTFTSVDSDGQSAFSPECSASTTVAPLPGTILTENSTPTQIDLAWAPVAGASGYDVFRAVDGQGFLLYQQNVTGTTLTDTNVSPSVGYSYYVFPIRLQGAGSRSNTVTGRPGSVALPPTNGIYAYAGSLVNVINWNGVFGSQSFNVYRSTTKGGEGAVPIAIGIGGTAFTDTTGRAGDFYYYTVTTVTQDGQSAFSAEITARIGAATLSAPVLLASYSSGSVTLTWNAITGASSYNIFRTDPVLGWQLYKQNAPGLSFTDTAVTHGIGYNYYVCPVSANGQGSQSNTVSGTP